MKGKNSVIDTKLHKKPCSFSLEQAFLSKRDYKIIFSIAVIMVLGIMALAMPVMWQWKLLSWLRNTFFVLFLVLKFIKVYVFIITPIMLLLYILLGYLLKKDIQKLEEAIHKRSEMTSIQNNAYGQ